VAIRNCTHNSLEGACGNRLAERLTLGDEILREVAAFTVLENKMEVL
jgi:hypothetical protein